MADFERKKNRISYHHHKGGNYDEKNDEEIYKEFIIDSTDGSVVSSCGVLVFYMYTTVLYHHQIYGGACAMQHYATGAACIHHLREDSFSWMTVEGRAMKHALPSSFFFLFYDPVIREAVILNDILLPCNNQPTPIVSPHRQRVAVEERSFYDENLKIWRQRSDASNRRCDGGSLLHHA